MKQLTIIILLFCSIHTYGQSKTSWLKEADKYYNSEDFFSALKYYKKILKDSVILSTQVLPYETTVSTQKLNKKNVKLDSNTAISMNEYIHHQIGMCYHFTYDYSHAEPHFKTAVDSGSIVSDKYYYGVSLMKNNKHDEAIKVFEDYIKLDLKEKNFTPLFFEYDTNHPNSKGNLLMSISLLETIFQNDN